MDQRIKLHKIIDGETAPPLGAPPRSTWEVWTAAPHRMMFLFGVLQIVVTIAWWMIDLAGRYGGWYEPVAWTVPPGWAHAFLMIYTVFPLFVFGFSMTALPNWTGQRLSRSAWMRAALPLVIGIPLTYIGFAVDRTVAAVGVTLVLVAWLFVWHSLLGLIWANRGKDKHAFGLLVVLGMGAVGVALFGVSLYTGDWRYANVSRRMGLWLFLLPLFMVVSHRLIPFFSGRVIRDYVMYRPKGSLAFLAAGSITHFALEMNALTAWTWVVDLPMAAWVGYLAFRWGLLGSFRAKLLVMLHLALVMLAMSFLLYGIASLVELAGYPALFGFGPMHALAIGYFTATTVAMVSRVSLGHAGRALEADPLTWFCFLAVLGVALIRIAGDIALLPWSLRSGLLIVAGIAWLALMIPWALRYAPIYLRPRADGKPG